MNVEETSSAIVKPIGLYDPSRKRKSTIIRVPIGPVESQEIVVATPTVVKGQVDSLFLTPTGRQRTRRSRANKNKALLLDADADIISDLEEEDESL